MRWRNVKLRSVKISTVKYVSHARDENGIPYFKKEKRPSKSITVYDTNPWEILQILKPVFDVEEERKYAPNKSSIYISDGSGNKRSRFLASKDHTFEEAMEAVKKRIGEVIGEKAPKRKDRRKTDTITLRDDTDEKNIPVWVKPEKTNTPNDSSEGNG